MTPSIWQLLIVLVIVLLLFGRGKIPQLMGDMAKGIKSFKKGMKQEDKEEDANKTEDTNIENKSDYVGHMRKSDFARRRRKFWKVY